MKELIVSAVVENIETVTDFVNETLELLHCPAKTQMKIAIAVDEIFSNIAYYAYGDNGGDVTVRIEEQTQPGGIILTFIDSGIPYNPLEQEDPDLSLSLEERPIGGIGIFMMKQMMDDISYCYRDGQNILNIVKLF